MEPDRFDDVSFRMVEGPEPPRRPPPRRRWALAAVASLLAAGGLAAGASALSTADDPPPAKPAATKANPELSYAKGARSGDKPCRRGDKRRHERREAQRDSAFRY